MDLFLLPEEIQVLNGLFLQCIEQNEVDKYTGTGTQGVGVDFWNDQGMERYVGEIRLHGKGKEPKI